MKGGVRMNNEDKDIFELMDDIPYEEKLQLIDCINVDDTTIGNDQKERIKSGVMAKLKVNCIGSRNKIKFGIVAAGFILVLFFTGLTPFGQKVVADIAEKLFFIPGWGKAEVYEKDDIFILEQPIEYEEKARKVVVSSVTKIGNTMGITILGDGWDSKLTIEDENGNMYTSNSSVRTSGFGEYYFSDIPAGVNGFKILCSDYIIPITLKKAESYTDYTSMGPTDIKNNFGITLVPKKDGNKIWFDLIQHASKDRKVALYGKENKEGHSYINILVKDDKGKAYPVEHLDKLGTTSRFYFKTEGDAEKFTVNIPEITLEYKVDNELSIPMPKEGETHINKEIVMHGFKLKITKILRVGNNVKVFVDTENDESKCENLSVVLLDMAEMSLGGYSWKFDDNITNLYYVFDINPKNPKLKMKFKEMNTIMKGPWTFEINSK